MKLLEAEIINDSRAQPTGGSQILTDTRTAEVPNETPVTKRKSIFDDVLSYAAKPTFSEISEEKTLPEELEEYMKEPILQNSSSELVYWRRNQSKFRKLSALANKYLSVPASSGGVERLFSIAGSLARARRNRITAKTLETLLMYREWRIRKSCV